MYLQGKESVFDLVWTPGVTYGDVYHQNEVEQSRYNFELANTDLLFDLFKSFESEARRLVAAQCVLPAYEMRSEEHTSELQSQSNLVCRLLLEKKKKYKCLLSYTVLHLTSTRLS